MKKVLLLSSVIIILGLTGCSNKYDYMDNLGFQNVLINAQTGKMTDPKGAQKVYDTPKIIR